MTSGGASRTKRWPPRCAKPGAAIVTIKQVMGRNHTTILEQAGRRRRGLESHHRVCVALDEQSGHEIAALK